MLLSVNRVVREDFGMKILFDENDDVVVEDIPDDLMMMLSSLSKRNNRTIEDEMRDILVKWAGD
jgi:hypothetical protein